MQVVSLGEAPPASELVAADRDLHGGAGEGEGGANDGRDAARGSSSSDIAGAKARSDHKDADVAGTAPSLKALDGSSFDREAVDALCRQAASDFFLYGAQHRSVTTPS